MPTQQLYRQCSLERPTENGKVTHVAWIPSQFAKVGKKVQIDSLGEELWTVVFASSSTRTMDEMEDQRGAHKRFAEVLS